MKVAISCLFALPVLALRGVPPELASKYVPSDKDTFKCFDGSETIPFSAVNDDYCDCKDGSDEPGTAACPDTQFYCENKGYSPVMISNSKVNDGVCDEECCDGSDEFEGRVKCTNKCPEFAEIVRKREEEKRQKILEGIRKRQEYVAFANEAKNSRKGDLDASYSKLKELEQKVEDLKIVKAEASEYQKKLDSEKEKKDKIRRIYECPSKLSKHEEALRQLKVEFHELEEKYKQALSALAPFAGLYDKTEQDGKTTYKVKENVVPKGNEKIYQDIEDFFNSYGTEYKEVSVEYDLNGTPVKDEDLPQTNPCEDPTSQLSECVSYSFSLTKNIAERILSSKLISQGIDSIKALLRPRSWQEELDSLRTNSDEAASKYYSVLNEKNSLSDQIKDLETREKLDFGPNAVFEKLYDQCFTYTGPGHKYELCFMTKATQMEKHSSWGGTNIGKFTKFERLTEDQEESNQTGGVMRNFRVMMYENGDHCPDVPNRKTTVTLECGNEDKLVSVTEPSKCEYVAKMITPAVCEGDDVSEREEL